MKLEEVATSLENSTCSLLCLATCDDQLSIEWENDRVCSSSPAVSDRNSMRRLSKQGMLVVSEAEKINERSRRCRCCFPSGRIVPARSVYHASCSIRKTPSPSVVTTLIGKRSNYDWGSVLIEQIDSAGRTIPYSENNEEELSILISA